MSTLDEILFADGGVEILDLEEEMRPERVFGAMLETVAIKVRIAGKPSASESSENAASCGASRDLTSAVSGVLGPAQMRSFLRWLADSLDNDQASLQLEVTGAEEQSGLIQTGARRLANQAFA